MGVKHIDGMLDVAWKQKGQQPIALLISDVTTSPEWGPLIAEAVELWNASTCFDLRYYKGTAGAQEAVGASIVGVAEVDLGNLPPADTRLFPNNQGILTFAGIVLGNAGSFLDSDQHSRLWIMQRVIRHELGHVLTLDHHDSVPNAPWGGGAEPDCCMANGQAVTAYDLNLLLQRYRG